MSLNYKEILSAENKSFKGWKELTSSRGIKKRQRALVQGKILVHEYFKDFYFEDIEIIFTADQGYPANLGPKTKSFKLSKALFNELNTTGVDYPMLCVPVPRIKNLEVTLLKEKPCVYLPLGDPKNLGGALRNALAFGVENVVLLEEAANPFHPQAIKASSGACFHLNLFKGPKAEDLDPKSLYVLDSGGKMAHTINWPNNFKILVGEEGQGPPKQILQNAKPVSIPISSKIESLNASQALGIVLYEASLNRNRQSGKD